MDATFAIDDFVTPTDDVTVSGEAGGPPYRFDTGDPDPSTHPLLGYGGLPLVVLHGPVMVHHVEWYYLTPAQLGIDIPSGWSPVTGPDGNAWLTTASVSCPASPMAVEALEPFGLTDGLAACYGDEELTITGDLSCSSEVDDFATGPRWMTGGRCAFDSGAHFSVYGLDAGLPGGRYAVTGHFDDPAAATCIDPTEPDVRSIHAVLHCRRAFVASAAQRVGASGLHVDGTARVIVDGLRARSAPGVDAPLMSPAQVPLGTLVYIVDGPVAADGYTWYLVHPFDVGQVGWVAAGDRSETPWLRGGGVGCPRAPLDARELLNVGGFGALACFGNAETELLGDVTCPAPDGDHGYSGPPWLRPERHCTIDLFGQTMSFYQASDPGGPREGRFRVTGHWDDPASGSCRQTDSVPPVNPADLALICRSFFVATGFEPA
ncbi:MAG TPA: SH3 domain-containing protein [Candidatus Limnocylindrales bacterium]|nr:SH3 domain-containing protein [Candidatus Limnocylindrales bacterium]